MCPPYVGVGEGVEGEHNSTCAEFGVKQNYKIKGSRYDTA